MAGCNEPKARAAQPQSAATDPPQDSLKPEPKAAPKPAADKPGEPAKDAATEKPAAPKVAETRKPEEGKKTSTRREPITAENNPTTKAGRGAPDLEKPHSPAAWVYIDGKEGKFKEEAGQPLLQWFIEEPVCATPSFRVEVFEPLIGTPKDFKAVLRTIESDDGTDLVYGIAAGDGTFEVGKEYNMLSPGENFVVRNVVTGDVVKELAPLPSGKYAIAAGILNSGTGKQTLAVTYFTVKSDE
jgi:hypothetical protein